MPIRAALLGLYRQMDQLLQQLSEEEYARPLAEFDHHSLGQHFRHILEFFQCLEQGASVGVVDYSARPRNPLYENDLLAVRCALQRTIQHLTKLDPTLPMEVCVDVGAEERVCCPSTLGREMVFAFEHAIHHLAIVRIGLTCCFPHVCVDDALGVAPATLRLRDSRAKA